MSDGSKPKPGSIAWRDLTVNDADGVKTFYEKVVGWRSQGLDMGGYEDWVMIAPESGETLAGICHARGVNADIPPQWLIYVTVADLAASLEACRRNGGEVVAGPRSVGGGRMAVIRDPAGAVCALFAAPPGGGA